MGVVVGWNVWFWILVYFEVDEWFYWVDGGWVVLKCYFLIFGIVFGGRGEDCYLNYMYI